MRTDGRPCRDAAAWRCVLTRARLRLGPCGHDWSPGTLSPPHPHLQLVVVLPLAVEPPLLDGIHHQAAAHRHAHKWRRLQQGACGGRAGCSGRCASSSGRGHTQHGAWHAHVSAHERQLAAASQWARMSPHAPAPHLLHRRWQLRPRRLQRLLYCFDGGPQEVHLDIHCSAREAAEGLLASAATEASRPRGGLASLAGGVRTACLWLCTPVPRPAAAHPASLAWPLTPP